MKIDKVLKVQWRYIRHLWNAKLKNALHICVHQLLFQFIQMFTFYSTWEFLWIKPNVKNPKIPWQRKMHQRYKSSLKSYVLPLKWPTQASTTHMCLSLLVTLICTLIWSPKQSYMDLRTILGVAFKKKNTKNMVVKSQLP
jgi:hypothetical protein